MNSGEKDTDADAVACVGIKEDVQSAGTKRKKPDIPSSDSSTIVSSTTETVNQTMNLPALSLEVNQEACSNGYNDNITDDIHQVAPSKTFLLTIAAEPEDDDEEIQQSSVRWLLEDPIKVFHSSWKKSRKNSSRNTEQQQPASNNPSSNKAHAVRPSDSSMNNNFLYDWTAPKHEQQYASQPPPPPSHHDYYQFGRDYWSTPSHDGIENVNPSTINNGYNYNNQHHQDSNYYPQSHYSDQAQPHNNANAYYQSSYDDPYQYGYMNTPGSIQLNNSFDAGNNHYQSHQPNGGGQYEHHHSMEQNSSRRPTTEQAYAEQGYSEHNGRYPMSTSFERTPHSINDPDMYAHSRISPDTDKIKRIMKEEAFPSLNSLNSDDTFDSAGNDRRQLMMRPIEPITQSHPDYHRGPPVDLEPLIATKTSFSGDSNGLIDSIVSNDTQSPPDDKSMVFRV